MMIVVNAVMYASAAVVAYRLLRVVDLSLQEAVELRRIVSFLPEAHFHPPAAMMQVSRHHHAASRCATAPATPIRAP